MFLNWCERERERERKKREEERRGEERKNKFFVFFVRNREKPTDLKNQKQVGVDALIVEW
jgi:hypothetical protein